MRDLDLFLYALAMFFAAFVVLPIFIYFVVVYWIAFIIVQLARLIIWIIRKAISRIKELGYELSE